MYLRVEQLQGILHLFKHCFDGRLNLHTNTKVGDVKKKKKNFIQLVSKLFLHIWNNLATTNVRC